MSGLDGSTMTGDPCTDGVSVVAAGQFRLRAKSSGQCLAVGSSTTVLGTPAWNTAMADECITAGEVWQLTYVSTGSGAGAYEAHATQFDGTLDIEMAQTADGTPAILYQSLMISNQRFFFNSRGPGLFEMAPGHVPLHASCISSAPPFPAIARCSASAVDQEWQLLPGECG